MKKISNILLAIACILVTATAAESQSDADAIRSMLEAQVTGWNSGNVAAYMEYYVKSDKLRFASGGKITHGWQATLDRYRRGYPDKAAMGTLRCTYHEIDVVAADTAIVFGKWELTRDKDKPWGLFTLVVKKTPEGWRVASDHTSSGE